MRGAGVAIVLLTLATSCSGDPEGVRTCEASLLSTLKAPASYKRVKYEESRAMGSYYAVTITYDAVNAFNAPIRADHICRYPLRNGVVDFAVPLPD
jgi:hypothetical protein